MRTPIALVCCLAFSLSLAPAAKAGDTVRAPPLRGVQCLDPGQARGWINVDDNHILVDAGRHKYRIEVSSACSALGYSQIITFRGDPILGRVCGGFSDAVITRDYPCRIERMDLLSKEQYKQALIDRESYRQARKAARKSKTS